MASIAPTPFLNEDEERKKKQQNEYSQNQGGISTTPAEAGALGSGGAPAGSGIASVTQPAKSGSFVDVSKFKSQNKDKAQALGQGIGDVLQGYGDVAKGNIDQVQTDFDKALSKGRLRYQGQTLTSDTFADLKSGGKDILEAIFNESGLTDEEKRLYGQLAQANYGGPTALSGQQTGDIKSGFSTLADYGQRTERGGRGLVDEYFRPRIDNYSTQAGKADQILLGTDPARQQISESKDYIKELALDDAYKKLKEDTSYAASEEARLQESLRNTITGGREAVGTKYDEKLQGSFDDYKNQVNQRRGYFQEQIRDYLNRIADEDDTNNQLGLTTEELQYLGISENELIGNLLGTDAGGADAVVANLIEGSQFGEGWEGKALTEDEYRYYQDLNALAEQEKLNPESKKFGDDYKEDQVGTFDEVAYERDENGELILDANGNPITKLQQGLDEHQKQIELGLDIEDTTTEGADRRYFKNDWDRFWGNASNEHGEANAGFNVLKKLEDSGINITSIDPAQLDEMIDKFLTLEGVEVTGTGNEAGGWAKDKVRNTIKEKLKQYIDELGLRNVLKKDETTDKTFGTGSKETSYEDFVNSGTYNTETGQYDRKGVEFDDDFWSDIL